MLKTTIYIIICVCLLSSCKSSAKTISTDNVDNPTEQSLEPTDARDCLPLIASRYTPWEAVQLSGKIKMDKLPINPSLKIYMEKNEEILISIRVPLMGEVGRIEITQDSILAINKMKNVYSSTDISPLLEKSDLSIGNLQDILLGRIYTIDEGTLTPYSHKYVETYTENNDGWYVVPSSQSKYFNYGFKTYANGQLQLMIMATPDGDRIDTEYTYESNNTEILLALIADADKVMEAKLSYGKIDYNPEKFARASISKKWKKVSFSDFLKSF